MKLKEFFEEGDPPALPMVPYTVDHIYLVQFLYKSYYYTHKNHAFHTQSTPFKIPMLVDGLHYASFLTY